MSTNNQVVISRIQHRRGRRENLPQPLRPGELALTADTEQVWIGGDPELTPAGISVYNDKSQSTAQSIIDVSIAEIKFVQDFPATAYTSLVTYLTNSAVVTLVPEDIIWDESYKGKILSINIDTAGSGYTNGTYPLTIVSPTGTGAIASATISGGAVTSITITSGGSNYTHANTTISLSAAGTPTVPAVLTVGANNIHGYSVFVGLDTNVDPDNTIANVNSEVNSSPVSTRKIETYSFGSQTIPSTGHAPPHTLAPRIFTANSLSVESHSTAGAVVKLINRVNSSTPNEITGIVYTNLNIEIGGNVVTTPITDHTHPYDLAFFIGGTPNNSTNVGGLVFTRDVFVSSAADHRVFAGTLTGEGPQEVYTIETYTGVIGTVTFPTANGSPVISIPADVSFVPGDRIWIRSPATPIPLSVSDILITIVGCSLAIIC